MNILQVRKIVDERLDERLEEIRINKINESIKLKLYSNIYKNLMGMVSDDPRYNFGELQIDEFLRQFFPELYVIYESESDPKLKWIKVAQKIEEMCPEMLE